MQAAAEGIGKETGKGEAAGSTWKKNPRPDNPGPPDSRGGGPYMIGAWTLGSWVRDDSS